MDTVGEDVGQGREAAAARSLDWIPVRIEIVTNLLPCHGEIHTGEKIKKAVGISFLRMLTENHQAIYCPYTVAIHKNSDVINNFPARGRCDVLRTQDRYVAPHPERIASSQSSPSKKNVNLLRRRGSCVVVQTRPAQSRGAVASARRLPSHGRLEQRWLERIGRLKHRANDCPGRCRGRGAQAHDPAGQRTTKQARVGPACFRGHDGRSGARRKVGGDWTTRGRGRLCPPGGGGDTDGVGGSSSSCTTRTRNCIWCGWSSSTIDVSHDTNEVVRRGAGEAVVGQ